MGDVEVVGDGEAVEVAGFLEGVGGDGVGHVEGEVSDAQEVAAVAEEIESGQVTEEDAVGIHAGDVFEEAGLAGFDDTGGGEDDFGGGIGAEGDGVFVTARVFEVAVDGVDVTSEGGFQLGEGAAEEGERRGGEVFGFSVGETEVGLRGGNGCDGLCGAPAGLGVDFFNEAATKVVELGEGEVALAFELVVEAGEFVGGGAEAAQLFGEGLGGETLVVGFFESLFGLNCGLLVGNSERVAGGTGDGEVEGRFFLGQFGLLPELAEVAFEGGVGGLVESDAGADAVPVDAAEFVVER